MSTQPTTTAGDYSLPTLDDLMPPYARTKPGPLHAAEKYVNLVRPRIETLLSDAADALETMRTQRDEAKAEAQASSLEKADLERQLAQLRTELEAAQQAGVDQTKIATTTLEAHRQTDAVSDKIVNQISLQLRLWLTDSSSDFDQDSQRAIKTLTFGGNMTLTVSPAAGFALIELPGVMHPEQVAIDDNGITSAGWSAIFGYLHKSTMAADQRQMLPVHVYRASYVVREPTEVDVASDRDTLIVLRDVAIPDSTDE